MISIRNRASLPYGLLAHIGCAALALCLPASLCAETLADAVAAAYDRNPQMVQQRYLQKARDEGYAQARSQYGPTLQVQTRGTFGYEETNGRHASGNTGESTATLSQTLYSSGRLRGNLAAARAAVAGGAEQLRQVEQQVVQNVIQVYASVLRDQARVEVGQENVQVLSGQLLQNRTRQRVGDVTLTDVAQSDARLAAAEAQLAALQADLAISRGQYLQVVGHNPGTLEPLPVLAPVPPTLDMAFEMAEDENPSLRIAQYTEQQSSAVAAVRRGEQGPTVSLDGQAIYTNDLLRFDGRSGEKQLAGGITITQPIFQGGLTSSRIREADDRNRADQSSIDGARRQALQAVTSAWSQLSAARTAVVTGQRQVDSAQQAFAGMSCEELNGLRSTIETLNAEQELQSAQLQLLQNRYQVYISHAAILASVGNLTAQQIADGITVYDPDANFRNVRNRWLLPFDLVGMGLDRIASAPPRGPLSKDLTGANVPRPENSGQLSPAPSQALLQQRLTPITQSQLRLPNGDTGRCPLTDVRPRR